MLLEWLVAALRDVPFKGKARLLSPLVPRRGTRTAKVHGYRLRLDLSEHIQRLVYLGAYERWQTAVVRRLLRPGGVLVDVGANVGYFSFLAASLVGPGGKVLAVEPSPYAADLLGDAVRANGLGDIVRLERCGLGREAGEATLYDPLPDNHSPSLLEDGGGSGRPGRAVPIRTLDECLDAWQLSHVDLLKVDVEGYEPAVIAGGARSLGGGRVRALLVELNPHWLARAGTTPEQTCRSLRDLGFEEAGPDRGAPSATDVEDRLFTWRGSR
jgi:FkbM family methyltransferase